MVDPLDPKPRDNRDLILETTAFAESLQAVLMAMASQLDLKKLIADYEQASNVLYAQAQGQSNPDRYLDLLEKHIVKRHAMLQALLATS